MGWSAWRVAVNGHANEDIAESLIHRLRLVAVERKAEFGHCGICGEAADAIEELTAALGRIAGMTDIEADFDGFEARAIALEMVAKVRGAQ